jgi:hypothetical protein
MISLYSLNTNKNNLFPANSVVRCETRSSCSGSLHERKNGQAGQANALSQLGIQMRYSLVSTG